MNKPDRILTDAASYRAERPLVRVNGRAYAWPKHPAVVICFDGCDPAYIESASAAGAIPAIDRMRREGFAASALAAMPTFTNPNNVSIVCGAPPAVHGVSGNFYLDRVTGVQSKPSGDFDLTFDSGHTVSGSRRYKSAVASLERS